MMEVEDGEFCMCVCVLGLCSLEGSLYTCLCLILEVTFIFKMGVPHGDEVCRLWDLIPWSSSRSL